MLLYIYRYIDIKSINNNVDISPLVIKETIFSWLEIWEECGSINCGRRYCGQPEASWN